MCYSAQKRRLCKFVQLRCLRTRGTTKHRSLAIPFWLCQISRMLLDMYVSLSPLSNILLLFQTVTRGVDTEYCLSTAPISWRVWLVTAQSAFVYEVGVSCVLFSQPPVVDRWIELCNHQWKLEIFCPHLSSYGEAPTAFCLPVEKVATFPPSVKLWSVIRGEVELSMMVISVLHYIQDKQTFWQQAQIFV